MAFAGSIRRIITALMMTGMIARADDVNDYPAVPRRPRPRDGS
jgi:hypothetical protein